MKTREALSKFTGTWDHAGVRGEVHNKGKKQGGAHINGGHNSYNAIHFYFCLVSGCAYL